MEAGAGVGQPKVVNVSGGRESARSLRELTIWCDERFGSHPVGSEAKDRPFDLPWVVLDSGLARTTWDWEPKMGVEAILEEIAEQAERDPDWLGLSNRA